MTLLQHVQMLLDESGLNTFWPAAQVYDAINTVQVALFPTLPKAAYTSASWVVEAGSDLAEWPSTIMIPKYVEDSSRQYLITTPTKLEQYSPAWKGEALGVPEYFVLWDATRIRLFPRPDDNYLYTLVGVPWGTEISASSTDLTLPPLLKTAVAYLSASLLLETTQTQLSDLYTQEALQSIENYKRQCRNNHPHNIQRLSPSTSFQVGQRQAIKVSKGRW